MEMSNEDQNKSQGLFKTVFSPGDNEPKEKKSFKGPSTAVEDDVRFAENFSATGGKFIYCESNENLVRLLNSLKTENKWNHIFVSDHRIKSYLSSLGFKQVENEFFMDNSDAAMSNCFALLADEGVVLLTPDQATNRRLTSFPPYHIIIASKANLAKNLEVGLDKFKEQYMDKLPSLLELNEARPICKENHARLLNAAGTPNVFVFYVDTPEIG